MATYISVRPGEMVRLKEGDINRAEGYFVIPHPKEKKPKPVPMIQRDIELVNSLPRSFPEMPFFRHETRKGVQGGGAFSPQLPAKWWKRACKNLGVEGVSFYPGTRHSSAMALKQHFSPEQIRRGMTHSTSEAFMRYLRVDFTEVRGIYEQAGGPQVDHEKGATENGKPLKLV